jgi:hypothetical protein
LLPLQTLLLFALIEITGVTTVLTVIVTAFDVAVAGVAQVKLVLIVQVITSPLLKDVDEYVDAVTPVLTLFNFQS